MPSIEIKPASAFMYTAEGKPILVDPGNPRCRASQTTPKLDLLNDEQEPLALDVEFQEYKHKDWQKWSHRIGRIAIVNTKGETIYDTYVRYDRDDDVKVKMPPAVFGVTWKDIRLQNGAKPISEVENNLWKIMDGRTIVGHGMRLDIGAINPEIWDTVKTVDTQHLYGQRALSALACEYLDESIQGDFHDPTEDARATMLLYLHRYPYNGRQNFELKGKSFVFAADDFPALGAASSKKGGKTKL